MDGAAGTTRVELASLGEDAPEADAVAVFDWRTGAVDVLAADAGYDVALVPAGWDYRILAPVLAGEIAVLGDPGVYVCAGDTRIADVTVTDKESSSPCSARANGCGSRAGPARDRGGVPGAGRRFLGGPRDPRRPRPLGGCGRRRRRGLGPPPAPGRRLSRRRALFARGGDRRERGLRAFDDGGAR